MQVEYLKAKESAQPFVEEGCRRDRIIEVIIIFNIYKAYFLEQIRN